MIFKFEDLYEVNAAFMFFLNTIFIYLFMLQGPKRPSKQFISNGILGELKIDEIRKNVWPESTNFYLLFF